MPRCGVTHEWQGMSLPSQHGERRRLSPPPFVASSPSERKRVWLLKTLQDGENLPEQAGDLRECSTAIEEASDVTEQVTQQAAGGVGRQLDVNLVGVQDQPQQIEVNRPQRQIE